MKQMSINLRGDIVIVDEAHNMEGICRDVGSATFREDHLAEAIDDCEAVRTDNTKLKPSQFQNPDDYVNFAGDAYSVIQDYLKGVIDVIYEQHLRNPVSIFCAHLKISFLRL